MEMKQNKTADLFDLMGKIGRLYTTRALGAQKAFLDHMQKAVVEQQQTVGAPSENPMAGMDLLRDRLCAALGALLGCPA